MRVLLCAHTNCMHVVVILLAYYKNHNCPISPRACIKSAWFTEKVAIQFLRLELSYGVVSVRKRNGNSILRP